MLILSANKKTQISGLIAACSDGEILKKKVTFFRVCVVDVLQFE